MSDILVTLFCNKQKTDFSGIPKLFMFSQQCNNAKETKGLERNVRLALLLLSR